MKAWFAGGRLFAWYYGLVLIRAVIDVAVFRLPPPLLSILLPLPDFGRLPRSLDAGTSDALAPVFFGVLGLQVLLSVPVAVRILRWYRNYVDRLAVDAIAAVRDGVGLAQPFAVDGIALRQRRPWWRTPLIMTVVLVVFVHLVTIWLGTSFFQPRGYSYYGRLGWENVLLGTFPWPLVVAGVLALAGMMAGSAFNAAAHEQVAVGTGVKYLDGNHPLTQRVHGLARRLELPPPRVGIMEGVNAYASGPSVDKATVVIGVPLIRHMAADELDAIIGHELGHIANGDMRQMQFAIGYQSMFGGLFSLIVTMITAGALAATKDRSSRMLAHMAGRAVNRIGRYVVFFAGELIVQKLSRTREYHADAVGAALTSPDAMMRALDRLPSLIDKPTPAENQFAYLMFRGRVGHLFSTHPTMADRRKALAEGGYIRQLPRKPNS